MSTNSRNCKQVSQPQFLRLALFVRVYVSFAGEDTMQGGTCGAPSGDIDCVP